MKLGNRLIVVLALIMLAGCARTPEDAMNVKRHSGPVKVRSGQDSPAALEGGRHIVPVRKVQNSAYVSLDDVAKATGYTGKWLPDGTYGLGDHDPAWVFRTGESEVSVAGEKSGMPSPALKEKGEMVIPVSALEKLFGDVAVFRVEDSEVAFFPLPEQADPGMEGASAGAARGSRLRIAMDAGEASSLLDFARQFKGVKYDFGAGSYKQAGTFDCSSFTQHVFDRFGIELPRVARAQAAKGQFVSRDQLKAGDLMFFYVPGRFKSNETVGHVGIYMGDGNMIHASPKPEDGVQITPIDKAYWKETYLFARRYS